MCMTSYLIHGLWLKQSGLHLWIEQIDGHKIVTNDAVPVGVFPPSLDGLIRGKRFRHRVDVTLLTPKGREVRLGIPTLAFSPEQAVQVLAQVAAVDAVSASKNQRAAVAPDLIWLAHMATGLRRFVQAGRVTVKLSYQDSKWYPMWQLAGGLGERGWLAQMTAAAPGVLIRNGGSSVAEDMAEELPHWIVNSLLQDFYETTRSSPWHEFSAALLESKPLRRGTAAMVAALNKWRDSISSADIHLVIIVEEPSDAPTTEFHWPIRLMVRSGADSPIPVRLAEFDAATRTRLNNLRREAILACPLFDADRPTPADPDAGDWDVCLSTAELAEFIGTYATKLRSRGFAVMLPKSWTKQETTAQIRLRDSTETTSKAKLGLEEIVAFDWQVSVGDVELTEAEMAHLVASKSGLIKLRGNWVLADATTIRSISDYMALLKQSSTKRIKAALKTVEMQLELAQIRGEKTTELRAERNRLQEALKAETPKQATLKELRELTLQSGEDMPLPVHGNEWYLSLIGQQSLVELPAPTRKEIPATVHTELRPYQHRGVDWLYWMSSQNLGAILADDMGLGKTLQFLALEAVERAEKPRAASLVVVPTTVVGNWAKEAEKFVPSLSVLVHHGSGRLTGERLERTFLQNDLIITSYGTITRDIKNFSQIRWHRVCLDEAQYIKNSQTKTAKALRALPADHRLALTGTPVENRLLELRSILDFCNPGILGSASFFKNHFAKAIEESNDELKTQQLRNLTAPFILRRLKTDPAISPDLPEKMETVITVTMPPEQAALYKAFVEDITTKLSQSSGIGRKGIVLASLTKIKQICNHPAHFLADGSALTIKGKHRSGKVEKLMALLTEARLENQKVLIFTQYKAFGDLLQPYIAEFYGETIPFLNGTVSKKRRDQMVESFQSDSGAPAMILSLKAGGTGLNLTNANVVIHMDRWWNPAVENQATDRAYRIGQDKDVFVYKLITAGTLEEQIHEIITGKLKLANTMVAQGEGWLTELSDEELATLLNYREQK